jgi:hypothetical protein
MDFDRLFSFLSEDREWLRKVGIAAILILTQVGTIAVMGWAAEISRRIAKDQPDPIPEWDPIGAYFITGLKLVGAGVVWFLPPALLVVCQSALMVFALQSGESNNLTVLLTATSLLVYLIVFVYLVAGGVVFSPTYVLVSEAPEFKQLLNPRPAWKLVRANLGGYILTILVGALIYIILVAVGLLACFVGSFFGGALGFVFLGILIGLATRQARINLNFAAENFSNPG